MRAPYNIVVGFDFGTSFSKVVVRDQNRKLAEALSFSVQHRSIDTVLLPTLISAHDGTLYPPFSDCQDGQIPFLKMTACASLSGTRPLDSALLRDIFGRSSHPLRCNPNSQVTVALLAWYFAHVLAAVNARFKTTRFFTDVMWEGDQSDDIVSIQISVPVDNMVDDGVMSGMREAIQIAYLLRGSVDGDMRDPLSAKEWLEYCGVARERMAAVDMANYCFLYPEVAAGVQAVLRSPTAKDGVYITMDVGAGTVDFNTFWRFTDENDRPIDYLSCDVAPLGAQRLDRMTLFNPYSDLDLTLTAERSLPFEPISEPKMRTRLEDTSAKLVNRGKVYQRNNGCVKGNRTWDRPRIYVWGGGSNLPLYAEALSKALRTRADTAEVEVRKLPTPDGFDLPDGVDFGRLAVAYGLSFHRANLEDIRLPAQLTPMHPRPNISKRFGELKAR